jgi:hypothetical protein
MVPSRVSISEFLTLHISNTTQAYSDTPRTRLSPLILTVTTAPPSSTPRPVSL